MIQFPLSGTVIDTRINGRPTSISKPFSSNVRPPQGDSIRPVLFIIYLEHARPILPRPTTPFEAEISNEEVCADDADFIGQEYADFNKIH